MKNIFKKLEVLGCMLLTLFISFMAVCVLFLLFIPFTVIFLFGEKSKAEDVRKNFDNLIPRIIC